MKHLRRLLPIACLSAALLAQAEDAPVYATAQQVKAMPACKATVEGKETFFATLHTADGKKFVIGSERGEQQVWHFVATALRKGETYEFPGAFLAYERGKYYGTAEAIKTMPAAKATLQLTGPCYSVFKTADGQWFTIGDPGSKPDVYEFLRSLTDGQSYEFPAVYLQYLKKKE